MTITITDAIWILFWVTVAEHFALLIFGVYLVLRKWFRTPSYYEERAGMLSEQIDDLRDIARTLKNQKDV